MEMEGSGSDDLRALLHDEDDIAEGDAAKIMQVSDK